MKKIYTPSVSRDNLSSKKYLSTIIFLILMQKEWWNAWFSFKNLPSYTFSYLLLYTRVLGLNVAHLSGCLEPHHFRVPLESFQIACLAYGGHHWLICDGLVFVNEAIDLLNSQAGSFLFLKIKQAVEKGLLICVSLGLEEYITWWIKIPPEISARCHSSET